VRINCRGNAPSLTSAAPHDRGGRITARVPSSRRGNRRAAVGGHVRLPTPPTTRAAAAPEKARPRRVTIAVAAGIKWPCPLPSKEDHRAARAPGSNKCDPRRVRTPTSGLEAPFDINGRPRLTETTDQQFEDWHGQGPSKPSDAKDGSTPLLPRTALLIRGSKHDPRQVRTGAQITRVRDDEGARI
jgi:hypothetical protein